MASAAGSQTRGDGHQGAMPLDLIAQGEEQCVYLPGKMILTSVMKALGAKQDTVVRVMPCQGFGYKAVVELDVSGISWIMQNPVAVSTIESDVCANEQDAESSGIQAALKYIRSIHRIDIVDYTTRLVEAIDDKDAGGIVYDALRGVRKIIEHWIMSLNTSDDLARKLENKEMWGRKEGATSPSGEIYIDLARAMARIVQRFSVRIYEARTGIQKYELEVEQETSRANERCTDYRNKGYLHKVDLSQKDMLSFVLDYLGAGQASYVNSRGEGGFVNSELVFFMPYLKSVKFVGNVKVNGKCLTSTRAEEHAAYKALRFIEKNYKVRVIDLNYNERLEAIQQHNNMVRVLEKVVAMADEMKKGWADMLECLKELTETYYLEPSRMYDGPDADEQIEAYAFCKDNIAEVTREYEKNYNACEKEFNDNYALGGKMVCKPFYIN